MTDDSLRGYGFSGSFLVMVDFYSKSGGHRNFSFRERMRSFVYACRGFCWLLRTEHNARVHLAASAAVILAGFVLRISALDWCWLILAIALVWIAEAFNTAVELLCDRISPGFDPIIGQIKDVCAAAVMTAALAAAGIGVLTLWHPLMNWAGV